jgi:AcrR family transcriptional regulator
MRAFAELAGAEPQAISLLVIGAFGAGPRLLEQRRHVLNELEARVREARERGAPRDNEDLTVKFILGGIREVTAARLREDRADELGALADELTAWAASYPTRLPSGRSSMPRRAIKKSQRERIVDATAAIVAEKGLAKLTIPEIASRANVSLQTFYEMYPSKHDAFLGAQKVGMHQALQVAGEAFGARGDSWPCAVDVGLRALIDYLSSEPAHAHLSVVDTFAASPEAIEIRGATLQAFGAYLSPGYEIARELPAVVAEAVVGGVWQVLHHSIESGRLAELGEAAPQLTYLALTPFLGPSRAAEAALEGAATR